MSEEAPALGRPDSPEPAVLERQNLLAVRRERLGRTRQVGKRRRRMRRRQGWGGASGPRLFWPLLSPQCRFPLHRLLVVARLGEGTAAEEVAGYHRELFENALEDHSREQVSGLLLLYSSYILHVVESCSSTIHLIIQDLASLQNQGHSQQLTSRLLPSPLHWSPSSRHEVFNCQQPS
ncbi:testis-expressed protein 47 [Buteo buteo]|uniref:testis-expressed protein 47 n=1 Tax=Buteo buteo TaxID=30397 RepID=UPI003EB93339